MFHQRFCFVLILLLLTGIPHPAAAQPTPQPTRQDTPHPVIIDTDMALDDWIAILYLLQRSDIDIKAITVAGTGEAHCKPGMKNAQHLLALGGQPEIPVACGSQTPLAGDHTFPQGWRDSMDSMLGLALPANPTPLPEISAANLIASILQDSPEPVRILTLGPLTNIGELLASRPDLISQIEMITIMGGAVDVPGNLLGLVDNTAAEWNIYIDPHAASLVLASGAPITLVPLDITNTVPLTQGFYAHMQHDRQTPSADFVFRALSKNLDFVRSGNYYFWDPLAAAIAADPTLAQTETQTIRVVEEEGSESGRTAADPAGSPILVATAVSAEDFTTGLVNVLNGRNPTDPLPTVEISEDEREENKEVVRRYYESVWGKADFLAGEALVAGSYLAHANNDTLNMSTLEGSIQVLYTLMPDLTVTVDVVAAEGDRVAAMITLQGTHTGSIPDSLYAGAPTGNPVTLHVTSVAYLIDGKVVEEWLTYDLYSLLTQVGALTVPQS